MAPCRDRQPETLGDTVLNTHGDRKYQPTTLLREVVEWDALRVEHRQIGSGPKDCVSPDCTELVFILSGQARVRRIGDGQKQEAMALPGTSWLVPAGTHETLLELDGSTECLVMFLPAKLLGDSALADYGVEVTKTQLSYVGGFADPILAEIGACLHSLMTRESMPLDHLFADGLRTALAAHLVGHYSTDRRQSPGRPPSLEANRLRRVLEFLEVHLCEDISLQDLASQACLSPYHFSRLFHEATGLPPHRYVVKRRIEAAKAQLASSRSSLAEVALDSGFGSQANFSRTFRKVTGLTPGQFRALHMC